MQKIIDSDGAFTVLNNVNADRIDCDGMINVPHGTVSADVIRVDGCIFAREIVGDDVRIKAVFCKKCTGAGGSGSDKDRYKRG